MDSDACCRSTRFGSSIEDTRQNEHDYRGVARDYFVV